MNEYRALIHVRDLRKAYKTPAGDFWALHGIDLEVRQGEFVAVVGKSGAGKSTLINMITGIDRPTVGRDLGGRAAPCTRMSEDQIAGLARAATWASCSSSSSCCPCSPARRT